MCDPVTMTVLAVASTAYSINEQRNQQAFQEDVAKNNAKMANDANMQNFYLQNSQLNQQEQQENEANAQAKLEQQLAVQKGIASQRTASGEAGVAGLSIDSLFADVMRQGSNNITTLERNQSDSQAQRATEKKVLHNNTHAGIQNPSFYKGKNQMLGAGLQIASAGGAAYVNSGGKFGGKKA